MQFRFGSARNDTGEYPVDLDSWIATANAPRNDSGLAEALRLFG